MKIFFYINNLSRGGAERVILALAKAFAEKGNDVTVITMYRGCDEYEIPEKVKRICLVDKHLDLLANKGFFKRLIRYLMISFIGYFLLRLFFIKNKPDLLISFLGEANKHALISGFGFNFKKIVSVRNDPSKEYSGFISKSLVKKLFNYADGIVFQTEQAKEWFPVSIQKKSVVIPNPIDERFFGKVYKGERSDIVSVGRLTEVKNHELLIRAFSEIADKIPDNLEIFGDGPLKNKLELLIKELGLQKRVFLKGLVKDIPNAIRKAKLFVLPSNYEGMPNALMESMALGVPSIATDCPCGGPRFLLENDYLFKVGDKSGLKNLMLSLVKDDTSLILASISVSEKSLKYTFSQITNKWFNYLNAEKENLEE